MTVWKLTKKQVIVRVCILLLLLIAAYVILCLLAARHWRPAQVTVQTTPRRESAFIDPDGQTQETRILPPEGYTRVPAAPDSFLAFMRRQPLYPNGSAIYRYDGTPLNGANAAAVYQMSVGTESYQQCADTIIRFWSDYFRESGQTDRLQFHLSNGFLCDWAHFSGGLRVIGFGETAFWMPLKFPDESEQTFRDWQMTVMRFAGTLSLFAESEPVSAQNARTGDLLCKPGTPGHAILLADEAVNADGERCFLLVQGLIPAQSAHILYAGDGTENPWMTQSQLAEHPQAAGYSFDPSMLRRWGEGFANAAEAL